MKTFTFDNFAKGNVYIYFENFEEWCAFKEEAKKRGFFFDSMDTFDKDSFVCANPNGYVYSQPIKVAVHYDEL